MATTTCAFGLIGPLALCRPGQKPCQQERMVRCYSGLRSLRSWTSRLPSVRQATRGAGAPLSLRVEADGLQYVFDPQEAKSLVESGYAVIDIRDEDQFKEAHIAGSNHIPFCVINTDTDPQTNLQRIYHKFGFQGLFYGLPFTKESEKFLPTIEAQFPDKKTKLLIICQKGLRSGRAGLQLEAAGYTNVAYLTKGLASAPAGLFPTEGTMEIKDVGRQGLQSVPPQVPAALLAALSIAAYFELTGAVP